MTSILQPTGRYVGTFQMYQLRTAIRMGVRDASGNQAIPDEDICSALDGIPLIVRRQSAAQNVLDAVYQVRMIDPHTGVLAEWDIDSTDEENSGDREKTNTLPFVLRSTEAHERKERGDIFKQDRAWYNKVPGDDERKDLDMWTTIFESDEEDFVRIVDENEQAFEAELNMLDRRIKELKEFAWDDEHRDGDILANFKKFVQTKGKTKDELLPNDGEEDLLTTPGRRKLTVESYTTVIKNDFFCWMNREKASDDQPFHLVDAVDTNGNNPFILTNEEVNKFIDAAKYGLNPAAGKVRRLCTMKLWSRFTVKELQQADETPTKEHMLATARETSERAWEKGQIKALSLEVEKRTRQLKRLKSSAHPITQRDRPNKLQQATQQYENSHMFRERLRELNKASEPGQKVGAQKMTSLVEWVGGRVQNKTGQRSVAIRNISNRDWAERIYMYLPIKVDERKSPDPRPEEFLEVRLQEGEEINPPTKETHVCKGCCIFIRHDKVDRLEGADKILISIEEVGMIELTRRVIENTLGSEALTDPSKPLFPNQNGNYRSIMKSTKELRKIGPEYEDITPYDARRLVRTLGQRTESRHLEPGISGSSQSEYLKRYEICPYIVFNNFLRYSNQEAQVAACLQVAIERQQPKCSNQTLLSRKDQGTSNTAASLEKATKREARNLLKKYKKEAELSEKRTTKKKVLTTERYWLIKLVQDGIAAGRKDPDGPFGRFRFWDPQLAEKGSAGILPVFKEFAEYWPRLLFGLQTKAGCMARKSVLDSYHGDTFFPSHSGRENINQKRRKGAKLPHPLGTVGEDPTFIQVLSFIYGWEILKQEAFNSSTKRITTLRNVTDYDRYKKLKDRYKSETETESETEEQLDVEKDDPSTQQVLYDEPKIELMSSSTTNKRSSCDSSHGKSTKKLSTEKFSCDVR